MIFNFIILCSDNIICMIVILLNLLSFVLWGILFLHTALFDTCWTSVLGTSKELDICTKSTHDIPLPYTPLQVFPSQWRCHYPMYISGLNLRLSSISPSPFLHRSNPLLSLVNFTFLQISYIHSFFSIFMANTSPIHHHFLQKLW